MLKTVLMCKGFIVYKSATQLFFTKLYQGMLPILEAMKDCLDTGNTLQ